MLCYGAFVRGEISSDKICANGAQQQPTAALMNDIDSPRAVTPPATIMSDEEEELREFCDGFDEGTTDRIVEAFG